MKKKFDTESLISFLRESFTKKTYGKTSKDILRNSDKIPLEDFQKEMELFLSEMGLDKDISHKEGRCQIVKHLEEDEIFGLEFITKVEPGNQGYFAIKFERALNNNNFFVLSVEVVANSRIRMFDNWCISLEDFSSVFKLYNKTFNSEESKKFKIKEDELSYNLMYRLQNFIKELVTRFKGYTNKDLNLLTRAINFDENICSRNFSNIVLKGEGL